MSRRSLQYTTGATVDSLWEVAATGDMGRSDTLLTEPKNIAHWTNYAFPATEATGTGLYSLTDPALPDGLYNVYYRERAGSTPDPSDLSIGGEQVFLVGGAAAGGGGAPPVLGSGEIRQGDTAVLVFNVTPGSLAGRTGLRLAGKVANWLADADADLVVDETAGLLILRGSVPSSSALASLTANVGASTVTLTLSATVTAALGAGLPVKIGIKAFYSGSEVEIGEATLTVLAGTVLAAA